MADQTAQPPPPTPPRRALTPHRAFALTAFLLVIAAALLLATEPKGESSVGIAPTAEPAVQDSNSKADPDFAVIFENLHDAGVEAVKARRIDLLDAVFTPGGRTMKRATEAIKTLKLDKVWDRSTHEVLSTVVKDESALKTTIRAKVAIEPCFVSEAGKDVTTGPERVERTSEWTLSRVGGSWRLEDAIVLRQTVKVKQDATC